MQQPPATVYVNQHVNVPVPLVRPTSGLATASLILGLLVFCTLGATGIPAVVCGVLALRDVKAQRVGGEGRAIAGIVLGGMTILGWAGWWFMVMLGAAMGPTP